MFDRFWNRVGDADPRAIALYERHYSCNGRKGTHHAGIAGAGQRLVLLSTSSDALFVWKRFLPRTGKAATYWWMTGIWCSVFRNEGPHQSSAMILEAEEWARFKWPTETLHTFVDPTAIESANPGYCFKQAGWVLARDDDGEPITTKRGLITLTKGEASR